MKATLKLVWVSSHCFEASFQNKQYVLRMRNHFFLCTDKLHVNPWMLLDLTNLETWATSDAAFFQKWNFCALLMENEGERMKSNQISFLKHHSFLDSILGHRLVHSSRSYAELKKSSLSHVGMIKSSKYYICQSM